MHVMSSVQPRVVAGCFAALLLVVTAGCASQQQLASPAPAPGSIVPDGAYIAHVEQVARRRGVTVQWVNRPTRHIARE